MTKSKNWVSSSLKIIMYAERYTEPLSVTRRWRALSYSFGKELLTEVDNSSIVSNIISRLTDVLLISGAEGTPESLKEFISSSAFSGIETVIQHIMALQQTIFVHILSCDVQLYAPRPNEHFSPEYMEEMGIEESSRGEQGDVICTIDVGLVSTTKTEGPEGAVDTVVVLKAKVASETIIRDLFQAGTKHGHREYPAHTSSTSTHELYRGYRA
jgi:hypothetical protein